MQVSITGKQLDVGDALRTHIEDNLSAAVEKYFENSLEAHVVLSREAHRFTAQVSVHVGRGISVQGHGDGPDAHEAFDIALDRVAKRLRRHKRRLRDHHRDRTPPEFLPAQQYILAPEEGEEEVEAAEDSPVVIAEMEVRIETLTVGEAVMRLDLADQNALMFRNKAHGGLNMVYRRNDGNIGWVDPSTGS